MSSFQYSTFFDAVDDSYDVGITDDELLEDDTEEDIVLHDCVKCSAGCTCNCENLGIACIGCLDCNTEDIDEPDGADIGGILPVVVLTAAMIQFQRMRRRRYGR